MHKTRPAQITSPVVSLNGGQVKAIPMAAIVGAIGIGIALATAVGSGGGTKRFLMSYLASYCFVLSIGVGCLFFVTIMHLTRAGWSATVRRIAEIYAMCLLPMFVLFLPILIPLLMGSDVVYEWAQVGYSAHHGTTVDANNPPPIETLKGMFLNRTWFTVRILAYFGIWGLLGYTYPVSYTHLTLPTTPYV